MFCALVQCKDEQHTSNYENMNGDLKKLLLQLKIEPTNENLKLVIRSVEFEELYNGIMHCEDGTESKMTVEYIKDVSSLLALVSAVRDNNLETSWAS